MNKPLSAKNARPLVRTLIKALPSENNIENRCNIVEALRDALIKFGEVVAQDVISALDQAFDVEQDGKVRKQIIKILRQLLQFVEEPTLPAPPDAINIKFSISYLCGPGAERIDQTPGTEQDDKVRKHKLSQIEFSQIAEEPSTLSAPVAVNIEVFISYSHKDEKLRNKLDDHLSILRQQGKISTWCVKKLFQEQNGIPRLRRVWSLPISSCY